MPKNALKTLSIIFDDICQQFNFFGINIYYGNNNLNRAIRSSFFLAQPVESKNKQNTRNKLKLEKNKTWKIKLELTMYETKTHKFPFTIVIV